MDVADHALLSRLVDEHGAALVLYAQQWCEAPEDVVQEAFIRLMRERPVPNNVVGAARIWRRAIERSERNIDALRVLEAIRIYGASHGGKLPDSLEAITEVPIPNDPITGLPFIYLSNGETALLQGPTVFDSPLNYEITMAAKP